MGLLEDAQERYSYQNCTSPYQNKRGVSKTDSEDAEATPRKGECDDCYLRPELWAQYTCGYTDRVLVRCSRCGKFIGYRLIDLEQSAPARAKDSSPGRGSPPGRRRNRKKDRGDGSRRLFE